MNIALILSGGTGKRMGLDLPKQYVMVNGRPILLYSLETIASDGKIDGIQIVSEISWQGRIEEWMDGMDRLLADQGRSIRKKFRGFSMPGENRQLSILNGLRDICGYASKEAFVFIHDAARPLLSHEQIRDCFAAAEG